MATNVLAQRKMVAFVYTFFYFTSIIIQHITSRNLQNRYFIGFGNLVLTKRVLFLLLYFQVGFYDALKMATEREK